MKIGQTRLAFVSGVLLLSVACSSERNAAPAKEEPAAAAAADPSAAEPAGTEESIAPPQGEAVAAPAPAPIPTPRAVAQAPIERRSAPAPVAAPAPAQGQTPVNREARRTPEPPPPAADRTPVRDEPLRDSRDSRVATRDETPVVPRTRMISIPAETPLRLALNSAVGSDTSAIEEQVTARVINDVVVGGDTVIPEGSRVNGRVSFVQPAGKVKGRAGVTVRFYSLTVGSRTYDINAEPVRRQADSSKGKDAQKIGIGAGAGAVIGGLLGGRKGAVIGAAAGGAGGTGMVLASKGAEVRLPAGTTVTTTLTDPLVIER
ncbi:MAG: hypothetical protein ACR2LU_08040 [Luteitalea sp.]